MNNNLMGKLRSLYQFVLLAVAIFLIVLVGAGCDRQEDLPQISLKQKVVIPETTPLDQDEDSIKIAVAAIISPMETFYSYRKLFNFISTQLGRPVQLVQRKTYREVNALLRKEEIDAGFICTGAYVEGQEKFGFKLLVVPVVNGETVYHSYIIVNRNSGINELQDLQGKVFAFTDPMSNSGKAAPTDMLASLGKDPATFFSEVIYTYSHDNSIQAVAHNAVDGAAVDSLVWEHHNKTTPEFTSHTKVITRSEPYGIPPVVTPKGLDPALRKELLDIFLRIHNDPVGKEILDEIMIEKFVEVDDSIYDSVRQMNQRKMNR